MTKLLYKKFFYRLLNLKLVDIQHKVNNRKVHNLQPIIIAGIGRCGTTLLYNSLQAKGFIGSGMITNSEDTKFEKGNIYKTHDYPPDQLPVEAKVIFMFGNPYDIVISTSRKINQWGLEHFEHLASPKYIPNKQLFQSDDLLLERLFDAWMQKQSFSFISIKYEFLYSPKVKEVLNNYLGFKIDLPPRRERKANWQIHPEHEQLKKVYRDLFHKIEKAEDIKIWQKKN